MELLLIAIAVGLLAASVMAGIVTASYVMSHATRDDLDLGNIDLWSGWEDIREFLLLVWDARELYFPTLFLFVIGVLVLITSQSF